MKHRNKRILIVRLYIEYARCKACEGREPVKNTEM